MWDKIFQMLLYGYIFDSNDLDSILNKIPLKRDASDPAGYSDTSGLD